MCRSRMIQVLTSTLSGCCRITKGLWCPMWISGSSYATECPTGSALGSSGPLVGVLHGKKFWTFLLCLDRAEKRIQEVNLIFIVNMTFRATGYFYNPSYSYLLSFTVWHSIQFGSDGKWIICNMCVGCSFVIGCLLFLWWMLKCEML